MRKWLPILVLLLSAAACPGLRAQQKDSLATVAGVVNYKAGRVPRDLPVHSAVVRLYTGGDSSFVQTGPQGEFTFRKVRPGTITLKVSRMGFHPLEETYEVEAGMNLLYLSLQQKTEKLDAAKVEAKVDPVKIKGDTVVYTAAAVNTLQGENAMQILEQMPGVTVSGGKIQVFGEDIKRTYVGGKLIFGNDPKAALNAILAEEVRQIKVYDEDSKEDLKTGAKSARKERVLDIIPTHEIKMAVDAHVLAGAGTDLDPDADGRLQSRYAAGVTGNFFSEKFLLFGNVYGNNVGRYSNRLDDIKTVTPAMNSYSELSSAQVGVERYWKDRFLGNSLKFSYGFSKDYGRTSSRERRDYTASEGIPAMVYESASASSHVTGKHSVRTSADLNLEKLGRISFLLNGEASDPTENAWSSVRSEVASRVTEQNERTNSSTQDRSISGDFRWSDSGGHALMPSFSASFWYGNDSGNSLQVDTSASSTTRRILSGNADGTNGSLTVAPGLTWRFVNTEKLTGSLTLAYDFSAKHNVNRRLVYDMLDGVPVVNVANTQDFTYDEQVHRGKATLAFNFGKSSVRADAWYGRSIQRDRERLPSDADLTYRFPVLFSSISFRLLDWNGNYQLVETVPSVDQLRDRIDDRNLLMLRTGNPDLKPSRTHIALLHRSFKLDSGKKGSISLAVSGNLTQRSVASRMLYYDRASLWGSYHVPAGTTLYTYDNVDGLRSCYASLGYNRRLQKIKSTLYVALSDRLAQMPQYQGATLATLYEHVPDLSVNAYLRPTRWLNGVLQAGVQQSRSWNDSGQELARQQLYTFKENFKVTFLKNAFVGSSYSYSGYRYASSRQPDVDMHMLGAMVGYSFLKGALNVVLTGSNLLDSAPAYSTETTANYFQQTWKTYYGRSVMLNVSFRFNRTGKNVKFGGRLNDGSDVNGQTIIYDTGL